MKKILLLLLLIGNPLIAYTHVFHNQTNKTISIFLYGIGRSFPHGIFRGTTKPREIVTVESYGYCIEKISLIEGPAWTTSVPGEYRSEKGNLEMTFQVPFDNKCAGQDYYITIEGQEMDSRFKVVSPGAGGSIITLPLGKTLKETNINKEF